MTGASSGAGTAYPFGAPDFTPVFSGVHVSRSLLYPRSTGGGYTVLLLSVLPSVPRYFSSHFSEQLLMAEFFWLLCCLSFFDLRIQITRLVSSNSSHSLIHLNYSSDNTKYFLTSNTSRFYHHFCCLMLISLWSRFFY